MSFQTHTNNVKVISKNTEEYVYREIDGFVTERKDIVLFTFYADCLPIFVYDKENKAIGVWHSGWPGSFKEIMKNGLAVMKEAFETKPENVLMGLGIGIQQENYEVGNDFYENFAEKFGKESELVKQSFKIKSPCLRSFFEKVRLLSEE